MVRPARLPQTLALILEHKSRCYKESHDHELGPCIWAPICKGSKTHVWIDRFPPGSRLDDSSALPSQKNLSTTVCYALQTFHTSNDLAVTDHYGLKKHPSVDARDLLQM